LARNQPRSAKKMRCTRIEPHRDRCAGDYHARSAGARRAAPMQFAFLAARVALAGLAVPIAGFAQESVRPASDAPAKSPDLRAVYDVAAYRLDLAVDVEAKRISGQMTMEARATEDGVRAIELDLKEPMRVVSVHATREPLDQALAPSGPALDYAHHLSVHRVPADERNELLEDLRTDEDLVVDKSRLRVHLPKPLARGESFAIGVVFDGEPRSRGSFDGFHWAETPDKKPWVNTSCQGTGSSAWWPCKDSFWHPEDKPEHVFVNATVPGELYAVSNGKLVERSFEGELATFRWRHDYPLETYSITLNVGPYIVVEEPLELPGIEEPVTFSYYVLRDDFEKARVSFAEVPRMLQVYGEAFGPFPFPKSKFALVQTNFWGMEHSTAVAYGSSFPAWLAQHGGTDRYRGPNKFFDYILIHESAHEWWGNAVSAADWGDFWIHEGFGTYAEGVYVEKTQGAERAEEFFEGERKKSPSKESLYRGKGSDSDQAYGNILYSKGAAVLHTLRQFVANDGEWWQALREFNLEFRYKNATTEDFRAVLERVTGREWKRFFDEWVYGRGYPRAKGSVLASDDGVAIDVELEGSDGTEFHVPMQLTWLESGAEKSATVELGPGKTATKLAASHPQGVKIVNLPKLLGKYAIEVK
jgi:aminopeptidase N